MVRSGVTESSRVDETEQKIEEGPEEGQVTKKEHLRKWEQGQMIEVPYDKLVISVGCVSRTFKTPGVRENAMFFKDVGDAKRVKRRVLECFELASMPHTSPEMKSWLLNFAVIGGGPTGTELSAALSDFIQGDLARLYPDLKGMVRITLYDVAPKVLSMFDESLSRYATEVMSREGVTIKTEHHIQELRWGAPDDKGERHEMDPKACLTLKTKEQGEVGVGMCVWATGNEMNKFVKNSLGSIDEFPASSAVMKEGAEDLSPNASDSKSASWNIQKAANVGALLVDDHLRVQLQADNGRRAVLRDVFGIGDNCVIESGSPPATAQATSQEARWLSNHLNKGNLENAPGFSFKNLGVVAYIGNARALMQIPHEEGSRTRYLPEGIKGRSAWLIWKAASLSMSVSWKNRLRILLVWIINPIFGRDISRY